MRLAVLLMACVPSLSLGADEPISRTAKSGPWSAAATWADQKVPGAGARVLIAEGHRVVYDVKSDAVIRGINISGSLAFACAQMVPVELASSQIHQRRGGARRRAAARIAYGGNRIAVPTPGKRAHEARDAPT